MSKLRILFIETIFLLSFLYGQNQRLPHFFDEMHKQSETSLKLDSFIPLQNESFFGRYEEFITSRHGERNDIPIVTPGNRALNAQEKQALQAIISDFQVNENAGGAWQQCPAIAMNGSGNFVAVWQDARNGGYDIYCQRYNSDGTPIGSNFKVNDDSVGSCQYDPTIAVDESGNFVVAWGGHNIYVQRYSSDGTAIGGNFKVNDDSSGDILWRPAIALDGSGNFVVVWEDNRNGGSGYYAQRDIYGQRYSSDGTAIGSNFRVNDDSGSAHQYTPAIAMDGSGNFIVVWHDERTGHDDIYGQRYRADGTTIGSNFKVNESNVSTWRTMHTAVAADYSGNFVVVWTDYRNGDGDIYGQRYLSDGMAIGSNFKVSDDSVGASQYDPTITVDGAGNFVVAWEDARNGDYDIYCQRYRSDGTAIGNNFEVNESSGTKYSLMNPSIAADSSGNFVVVWPDYRNVEPDIYGQRYDSDGMASNGNFKINDDSVSSWQLSPAIVVDNSGNFLVVWTDYRNGDYGDIYGQRYRSDGTAIGSNFKVNDDSSRADQYNPAIAMDGSGNFVVVWEDHRDSNCDIYGQRYRSDGTVIGSNFKVNDFDFSGVGTAIAMDASGNFVVIWTDCSGGTASIYGQRYRSDGTPIDSNFKVNDYVFSYQLIDYYIYYPDIAMDSMGDFVIVWTDYRNDDGDIYCQRYSSDGTAIGSNFKVNDDSIGFKQYVPQVAMDGSGDFVVAWVDKRNGDYDIYCQRYGSDGTAIGSNFQVNEDNVSGGGPAIAMDGSDNFVIVWGNGDIYAQRYSANGAPLGHNFVVNMITEKAQFSPDVKLWNGRIYTTWASNHVGGTGFDIWANVLDWNNPTDIENQSKAVITQFKLSQNYPNPFNPTTTISYALPKAGNVKLTVYNLLGQKVRTLVNMHQPAGQYNVPWNGHDEQGNPVASGVYVYKLKVKGVSGGEFEQVKKMVLMK